MHVVGRVTAIVQAVALQRIGMHPISASKFSVPEQTEYFLRPTSALSIPIANILEGFIAVVSAHKIVIVAEAVAGCRL